MDRRRALYQVLEAKRLVKLMPKSWNKSWTVWFQVALVLMPWVAPKIGMPEDVWYSLISVLAGGTIVRNVGGRKKAARKVKEAALLSLVPLLVAGCATAKWDEAICPVDEADGVRKCKCDDGVIVEQHVRSARTEIKCGSYVVPVQMFGTVLPPKLMEPAP